MMMMLFFCSSVQSRTNEIETADEAKKRSSCTGTRLAATSDDDDRLRKKKQIHLAWHLYVCSNEWMNEWIYINKFCIHCCQYCKSALASLLKGCQLYSRNRRLSVWRTCYALPKKWVLCVLLLLLLLLLSSKNWLSCCCCCCCCRLGPFWFVHSSKSSSSSFESGSSLERPPPPLDHQFELTIEEQRRRERHTDRQKS